MGILIIIDFGIKLSILLCFGNDGANENSTQQ
jgi:hypothetical protein